MTLGRLTLDRLTLYRLSLGRLTLSRLALCRWTGPMTEIYVNNLEMLENYLFFISIHDKIKSENFSEVDLFYFINNFFPDR